MCYAMEKLYSAGSFNQIENMLLRFFPFLKKNSRPLTAIAFSIYGLYLRVTMYSQRGLYPDELNQLAYTSSSGLLPFWKMYTPVEVTAFPGDYLLTFPFVKLFGTNKWLITIPHIIVTVIGFYLLYLVSAKYLKSLLGLIIVFAVFSSNFNLTYHAFEFRPYAALPTLALAVFLLSERVVCRYTALPRGQKFFIGLFFFLTVGFHAHGILITALAMSFHILMHSHSQSLAQVIRKILPFALTLTVFGVPLFIWYYIQNPITYAGNFGRGINTFDFIPNPLTSPDGFLRSVLGNLIGMKRLYPLLIGVVLAFLIPHKSRATQFLFLALLVILPIQLILLSDLWTCYWFVQRQFVWVMPFFAVWLAWCWDSVFLNLADTAWVKKITSSRE